MSLLFPITSILGETTGKIIDKLNFNKNKIGYRPVIVIGFLVMLILTILFLIITDSPYPSITTYGFILITTMIFLSTLENITDTIGLSKESLSLREPISNFGHLMAALIAFFIFESERDPTTLLFVFIGVLILLWVNTEKHHLQLFSNEGTKYFVYGMVLSAIIVLSLIHI